MATNLEKIAEEIQGLTLLEASELIELLEKKLGVSAAAPMTVAAAPAAAAVAPEEEKTEFDVILKEIGPKKIQVIKVVRQITSLGLKEAKELVDSAPSPVVQGVHKEQAEDIKAKLEAESAVVEIR
ncbi:MAG: 50S ribosomal protein L7/L12 [Anaerolineae bacterium]